MLIGETRPREGRTGLCPSAACLLVVTEFLETSPNSHHPAEELLQQPTHFSLLCRLQRVLATRLPFESSKMPSLSWLLEGCPV